jgi:hypothetical protein
MDSTLKKTTVKSSRLKHAENPHLNKHGNEVGTSLHQNGCGHGYTPNDYVHVHGNFFPEKAMSTYDLGASPSERSHFAHSRRK